MSSKTYNFLPLVFCCLASFVACKTKEETAAPVIADVNVVAAVQRTVPVYTDFVGQTLGKADVEIQPRVDGWITGMYFKEGQVVQKGSLLYTIDDLPIKTRIDAAAAEVARAQTVMENKKADLDRIKPLAEMRALSQRDLDAATAAYKASVNEVEVAQARLNNAKIELDYTQVKAPISGLAGISKVQVGDYVNRTNIGGIVTISTLENVRVRFPITETEYLRFAKRSRTDTVNKKFADLPVQLILSDGTLYPETGKIDLANRQVDPETGSLLVQALFNNRTGILRPGQYVKVRFQTDIYENAVLVPQQAVNQLQSIYQVFILNDSNKLSPRVVTAGARIGGNWVITEGLKTGEKVAVIGSASINIKNPVRPVMMNWNYDSTSRN